MNRQAIEASLTEEQRAHRDIARRELDASVAKRKARLEEEGHATELERLDATNILSRCGDVPQVGGLFAEMASGFQRLAEKEAAFRAGIMPEIEAAPQAIGCAIHGEACRPLDVDATCNATRPIGKLRLVYAICAECAAQDEAARKRRYWLRHGIEERNVHATFAAWDVTGEQSQTKREAVAEVRKWCEDRGNFLLLIGASGTGKGFLAAAALKRNGSGIFIKHPDMLSDLRASYGSGTTQDLVTRWQDCEMLVLDELGVSPGGKDEEPLLYQVLADRYDKRRPTIITSNKPVSELRDLLGARLIDRIKEDCIQVTCTWPSWRTGK